MVFTKKPLFSSAIKWLLRGGAQWKTSKGGSYMTANQISYWNYVENSRHNRATERESNRSNLAREIEENRSNLSNESISRERNSLQREANTINYNYQNSKLAEDRRHNLAQENLGYSAQEIEQQRVRLGYQQLENARSIAQMQAAVGYANVGATYANINEQMRSNIAREVENQRSHMAQEANTARSISVDRINASTRSKAQALESQKWNEDLSKAQRQANYFNTVSGTELNKQRSQSETTNRSLNTWRTAGGFVRDVANVVNSVVGTTTKLIGGK